MGDLENIFLRNAERLYAGRRTQRHGLVTSYDPKKHLGKIMIMPEGFETGWLPIQTGHIGQEYGIATGLQPGSGQGDMSGSSSGASTGSSSGAGGGQAQGDQVIVDFQEGDFDAGKIIQRVHSKVDKAPTVQSGEMVLYTKFKKDKDSGQDAAQTGGGGTGQKVFFKNDGSLNIEDGFGGQHLFDGKGNVTGNATKVMTHRIVSDRDSSPFSSLTDDEQSGNSQTIHHTTYDKNKGVTTGAFQDQHKTTWDQNGVSHTSSASVSSTAPNIPHNGNTSVSQNLSVGENITATDSITAASVGTFSDERLKTNIEPLKGDDALDDVMRLKPKSFHKKGVVVDLETRKQSISEQPAAPSLGFIAQELREVFPQIVHGHESKGYLSVHEHKLVPILVAAFQEYVAKTDRRIAELEARLQGQ